MFVIQFNAANEEELAAYDNTFWSVFWGKGGIGVDATSYDPQTGIALQAWRVGDMSCQRAAEYLKHAFNYAQDDGQKISVSANSAKRSLSDFFSDTRDYVVDGVVTIRKEGDQAAPYSPDFSETTDGVTSQLHLKPGRKLG